MREVDRRVRWAGLGACLLVLATFALPRGAIISADGATLAQSIPSNDQYKYQRTYPEGALFGQVTGYDSLIYGTDGLEREYNSLLTTTSGQGFPKSFAGLERLFTTQPEPDNLHITVLARLQQLARQQLAGRFGAVVAVSPSTGAVLAMYSNPSYNPAPLASHNVAVEQAAWKALNANPGLPLLAASYRQRFFPGSVFKIITAAAVYDHRPALANRDFPVSSGFVLPG